MLSLWTADNPTRAQNHYTSKEPNCKIPPLTTTFSHSPGADFSFLQGSPKTPDLPHNAPAPPLSPRKLPHLQLCVVCPVRFFVTPWTIVHQAPLSMGFSSKNTGVGRPLQWTPCPLPGDLPNPEIKSTSPALAGVFFTAFTEVFSDQYPSCPLHPRTEACYLKRRRRREWWVVKG